METWTTFSPDILFLLFLTAMIAGWVDAIAGGGGLLTIPALLLAGMPPATAIATNKLQGSVGSLVAATYFVRQKMVSLPQMRPAIFTTFLGAITGSWLILQLSAARLAAFIPILLVAIGIYFLLSKKIKNHDEGSKMGWPVFAGAVTPLLGFYDGFFGPGTGSFMALAFILALGFGAPKATAHAKVLNFVSSFASLIYFIVFGEIAWLVGTLMIAGQFIGARAGARVVLQKGVAIIRPVVVSVCFLMALRLFLKNSGWLA